MKSFFKKRGNVIALVVVVLALVAWAIFYDVSRERTVSVASDDDFLSISWPEDAFPDGVSADDVRILKKDAGDYIAAYELLPDGAVFAEPGLLSFTIPAPDKNEPLPLLLLVGDGGPEILETRYEYSDDLSELAISAPISHFSELIVEKGLLQVVYPDEYFSSGYFAGEPFARRISVTANPLAFDFDYLTSKLAVLKLLSARVRHSGEAVAPVARGERSPEEPQEIVLSNFFAIFEEDFLCTHQGLGDANIRIEYIIEYVRDTMGTREQKTVISNVLIPQPIICYSALTEEDEAETNLSIAPEDDMDLSGISPPINVVVLEIDGDYYPVSQFDVIDNPDSGCAYPHYRLKHDVVYGLEDLAETLVIEFENDARYLISDCGLGSYLSFVRSVVSLTPDQYAALDAQIIEPF